MHLKSVSPTQRVRSGRPRRKASTITSSTPDVFREQLAEGEFLEHADVFGHLYGTARSSVAACFASGADVILEIDWQGAAQVREHYPDAVSYLHSAARRRARCARGSTSAVKTPMT